MKTRIILIIIVCTMFLSASVLAQLKEPASAEEYRTKIINSLENKENIHKIDIHLLNETIFAGESELVYDVCSQVKKYNIDEKYLKNLDVLKNTSLIKTLVKNGTITSIGQIPEKSFNIYDPEAETVFNKGQEEILKASEEHLAKYPLEAQNIQTYNEHIYTLRSSKSPFQKYQSFLARMVTYELACTYPRNADKFTIDYINKFGYDQLSDVMVSYFIEIKAPDKAINVIDAVISNLEKVNTHANRDNIKKYTKLRIFAVAAGGNLDSALEMINKLIDAEEIDRSELYSDKIQLYYLAGRAEENKDKIESIKNELTIISNERKAAAAISLGDKAVIDPSSLDEGYYVKVRPRKDKNGDIDPASLPSVDPVALSQFRLNKKEYISDYEFYSITVAYLAKILL